MFGIPIQGLSVFCTETSVLIPYTDGTPSSDFTSFVSEWTNGVVSVPSGTCSSLSGTSCYMEKDWGVPRKISKFTLTGASNDWLLYGSGIVVNFVLKGWNGSSWDTLSTSAITQSTPWPNTETVTLSSPTAYSKHRLELSSTQSGLWRVAELQFWELDCI